MKIIILFFLLESVPLIVFSQGTNRVDSAVISDTTIMVQPVAATDTLLNLDSVRINYIPDTLFLINGDMITGKILAFEQGRLKIDGQGPGMVNVKWYKILSIGGGNRIFKVEDINGKMYIGQIGFSSDTGKIHIKGKLLYSLLFEDVLRIFPLESEWYRGIKGTLGAGLNYTKSSDVLTINTEYNLYYVISKWRFLNDFSFVSTSTENDGSSIRVQTSLQSLYSLPNKWVLSEINAFNRNDELGVKSRISFGVGGGNNLVQTEWQRLLVLTGIIVNLERDIETSNVVSNIEWPFSLQHTIYKFDKPNLSVSTSIASFVGITENDRYRLDASTDITWEFVNNFKLQFSVYYNYDNKTIEGKNSKDDYGTVLSLLLELK